MSTSSTTALRRNCERQAFTLTDLIVVLAVVSVLATVALASQGSNSDVLRTQCASNLRQIGVALNVYAADADGYLPICKFRDTTPWYTYEIARVFPGSSSPTEGYMNLGLLHRTQILKEGPVFFCPAQAFPAYTFDYYVVSTNGWTTPPGSGDDNIRSGFSYFPQVRATEFVGSFGTLPHANTTNMRLEYGIVNAVTPTRLTEVNPQKSITTDLVHILEASPHRAYGELTGLNALFPDGSVVFQNARENPQLFDPTLWQVIGSNGRNFRRVMNSWEQ